MIDLIVEVGSELQYLHGMLDTVGYPDLSFAVNDRYLICSYHKAYVVCFFKFVKKFDFEIFKAIKADGKTTSQELSTLRSFFTRNFGAQAGGEAEEIVRELLTKDYNLYEVCGQIRSCMDYSQRLQLYHYLVALGACDGLHQREIDVLETIATYIGLSKAEVDSIFAQFRPSNDSNYRILEIEPDATDDEVKKAYRKMAIKYHPDKVATLGEDVQKAAEEKFKAVNQAYEAICKERGI